MLCTDFEITTVRCETSSTLATAIRIATKQDLEPTLLTLASRTTGRSSLRRQLIGVGSMLDNDWFTRWH